LPTNKTGLKPYRVDIYKITDHIAALAERYGGIANTIRGRHWQASEAGDANTADILTSFSRAFDKSPWFLEAHLQDAAWNRPVSKTWNKSWSKKPRNVFATTGSSLQSFVPDGLGISFESSVASCHVKRAIF
jgi:hypothetical protein